LIERNSILPSLNPSSAEKGNIIVGTIMGSAMGSVVFAGCILTAAVLWQKRRKNRGEENEEHVEQSPA